MRGPSAAALFVLAQIYPAYALWPFGSGKRFTTEAFIDAGSLGLEDVRGRVAAVGDWNGDQKLDLFTLSDDRKTIAIYTWDHDSFEYKQARTLSTSREVTNIVPSDFNHDGHLDLLVMYEDDKGGWWGPKSEKTAMEVYIGDGKGGFADAPWTMPESTGSQPFIFDAEGSLRPSLLGREPSASGSGSTLRTWLNSGSGMMVSPTTLKNPEQACQLADPHSSAFIDINGDCLADLVLHCDDPTGDNKLVQIWLNRGSDGFELAKTFDLPSGSGPLSFADMNRDGSIDIVFPTCSRISTSTGVCSDASINILYNFPVPLCSGAASERDGDPVNGTLKCRGWGELCAPDAPFDFAYKQEGKTYLSVPFPEIWPMNTPDLLVHVPNIPSIPLPLRPGDFNLDGFPDLLLTVSNGTASPHGTFGRNRGSQAKMLRNVPCAKGVAGCGSGAKRGFKVGGGKGWSALDDVWDAWGASWIDIDDDGSLDIMVQRSGEQNKETTTFIQNNFYHDAFFLKAQLLNGACDRDCEPMAGGAKYSPLGVSYSGATYKFTILDTLGRRVAQQAAQLPQTGYHALGTPYSYIGLGRTNNYVERLYIGSSLHPPHHSTFIESLIPNSQIIINPPFPLSNVSDSADSPVKHRSSGWRSELYLRPSDWVPWVGAAVVGLVIILGFVVIGLNEREKKEDEDERRRALHAINFQAL